jgi:hypothetical protein
LLNFTTFPESAGLSGGGGWSGLLLGSVFLTFKICVATLALFAFVELLAHNSLLCCNFCDYCFRTMKRFMHRFNIYLLASVLLAVGCSTSKSRFSKEEQSTIRLYLEGSRADASGTGTVLVGQERIPVTIEREPFLMEDDLRRVVMVNDPGPNGGSSIELIFNEHGALMLDMLTTANKGKHIVVFSQFPHPGYKAPKQPKKPKKTDSDDDDTKMEDIQAAIPATPPENEAGQPRMSGWLAAVQIHGRNPSGIFRFSPDASPDETARIVRGLKNVLAYEKSVGRN